MAATLSTSQGLRFYREVCRCVPFLIEQFEVKELTTKHNVRRVVAERFLKNKDVTNPDVVQLTIFKGRQELEEIMLRYRNRHHVLNEWVLDPLQKQRDAASKPVTGFSPFLEQFLESNHAKALKTY